MTFMGQGGEVNFRSPIPIYEQVARIIRAEIISGKLPPDELIPSQAALVSRFGVARGSVAKATRILRDQGFLYISAGKGVYPYRASERPSQLAS